MAIKIEMLRSFCAVAKAGNLATAAAQLGRTPSAVSMTLKQLENHLDGALFESDRKTRLTPLGEQVLALGLTQLRYFDSTISQIELAASAPQGVLRIAAVPSVAAQTFPGLVQDMRQRHPRLKIELRDADTGQVVEALSQGWADIGIASAAHELRDISTRLLFEDRFGVVMAETHPLAQQADGISIQDAFTLPVLRNALSDQIETPALRTALSGEDVTVHNTQSLLAMVRTGQWATILPQSVIHLGPKGLVFRPLTDLPVMRQVYLYQQTKGAHADLIQEAGDILTTMYQPAA